MVRSFEKRLIVEEHNLANIMDGTVSVKVYRANLGTDINLTKMFFFYISATFLTVLVFRPVRLLLTDRPAS